MTAHRRGPRSKSASEARSAVVHVPRGRGRAVISEKRRGQERPGERPGSQERLGEASRGQKRPGEARRGQERPGAGRGQERPGEAGRGQERPGKGKCTENIEFLHRQWRDRAFGAGETSVTLTKYHKLEGPLVGGEGPRRSRGPWASRTRISRCMFLQLLGLAALVSLPAQD